MRPKTKSAAVLLAALVAVVRAETLNVDAGKPDDQFNPMSVSAKQGDVIKFKFHESTHDLAEVMGASPSEACTPAPGKLLTPKQADGAEYLLPVNDTMTHYFVCLPHCKSKGMVFVLNPPNNTIVGEFKANAMKSIPAPAPAGGSSGTTGSTSASGSPTNMSASPTAGSTSSTGMTGNATGQSSGTKSNGASPAVLSSSLPIGASIGALSSAMLFLTSCILVW